MKKLFVALVVLCGYINLTAMELALPYLKNDVTLPPASTIKKNLDNFLSLLSLITPHVIHHDTQMFFKTAELDTQFGGKSVTPVATIAELQMSWTKDFIPQICNIIFHEHPIILKELEKAQLIEKQMRYALNPLETVITLPSNTSLQAQILTLTNSDYLCSATTKKTNTIASFFINKIKPLLDEKPTSAAQIMNKIQELQKDPHETRWLQYIYMTLFCEHPFIIAALRKNNTLNEQHLDTYLWNVLQNAYGKTAKARFCEPFKIEEKNEAENQPPIQQHPFSTPNPELLLNQVNVLFDKILW